MRSEKVLVGAAEVIDWNRRMEGKGIKGKGTKIDWPALMRFKKTFVAPVPKHREESFAKAGIATFHGRARFAGNLAVRVGDQTLETKNVVIASGACPAKLGITGEEHLITSDQFLELKKLPQQIIFVGGGYISFEFAHVAARAGAKVSILHRGARPLTGFDPDLVATLIQASETIGIRVQLSTAVEAIEKKGSRFVVHAFREGKKLKLEADLVVHGAGRVPEVEDLDLDKAGVQYEKKRGFRQRISSKRFQSRRVRGR
jgi:glutathione reductase (NADPH)